jgi:hypothetical protein
MGTSSFIGLLALLLTPLHSSHDIATKLVTLTINSGFWTASVALAALITVYNFSKCTRCGPQIVQSIVCEVQVYGAVYYILCPLYCNTVIANLNARQYVRDKFRSEFNMGSALRFEVSLANFALLCSDNILVDDSWCTDGCWSCS